MFLLISIISFAQAKLDVYFDFDKYDLNEAAVKKINTWIAEGKDYEVTKLYGFFDWKGTSQYNDTLALKRVYTRPLKSCRCKPGATQQNSSPH